MPKISVQMVVKNEEYWVWYSIMSVIDHVDEIIIYDTGSTDKTAEIIKTIKSPKIHFKKYFETIDADIHTLARQDMFKHFKYDWILMVDGDEVWTEAAIAETCREIKNHGENYEYLIQPYLNMVGDVYHYQAENSGRYQIGKYRGHITIRAINTKKIPGLHIHNPYPREGFYDENKVLIQDRRPMLTKLMTNPYLHMTHLKRSNETWQFSTHRNIQKCELGIATSPDFCFPKPFYLARPKIVPSPWQKRNFGYTLNALWQTPLKSIKRRFER